ncbi:MAG: hypothetical protein DWQ02_23205 [Bacteroidetes bacterium]|nr:MAG: hypothetical protein DWQ02_23205 [Bacteroidota bacterium]
MQKIDFKKELKHLYKASAKKVEFVDVPAMNFLKIDGKGNPNTSPEYKAAVEALFAVAYGLKFAIKKGPQQIDYGVLPLEGLWWVENMQEFDVDKKEDWLWTMMIMQPEYVTKELFQKISKEVKDKKQLETVDKIRFEPYEEGKVAQLMHIGPFSEEGPNIQRVHDFITDHGFQLSGKHHEIYLSDIRRAAPEKWKTIIRQPYR